MLNFFLTAMILSVALIAESNASDKTNEAFPARLAGTWKSEANASNRLGPRSGVLANCDSLTFKNEATWKNLMPAFVDPQHRDAPLHIGGVAIEGNAEALFMLRGRIGFNEIGTTPGGGGAEQILWESLHLVQGVDPSHDMLVIGRTIYKRQP